jgi:hypothetical protein
MGRSRTYFEPNTRIGKLTILREVFPPLQGETNFFCKCDCGKYCEVLGRNLKQSLRNNSKTRSCGCFKHQNVPILDDLIGHRIGRLKIIRRDFSKIHSTYWICLCECGNKKSIAARHLKSLKTLSCGCIREESCRETGLKRRKG